MNEVVAFTFILCSSNGHVLVSFVLLKIFIDLELGYQFVVAPNEPSPKLRDYPHQMKHGHQMKAFEVSFVR